MPRESWTVGFSGSWRGKCCGEDRLDRISTGPQVVEAFLFFLHQGFGFKVQIEGLGLGIDYVANLGV